MSEVGYFSGIRAEFLPACRMLRMVTEMEERDNEIAASKIVGWYNRYQKMKNLLTFLEYLSLIVNTMLV